MNIVLQCECGCKDFELSEYADYAKCKKCNETLYMRDSEYEFDYEEAEGRDLLGEIKTLERTIKSDEDFIKSVSEMNNTQSMAIFNLNSRLKWVEKSKERTLDKVIKSITAMEKLTHTNYTQGYINACNDVLIELTKWED